MRYIGIDGGGTKTALCLLENGKVTARAVCGPLNYRTAKTDALRNLKEGLDLLLAQSPGPVRAAGLGDPALDECGKDNDNAAQDFAEGAARLLGCPLYIRSDAYMALYAGTLGKTGGVCLISGTGAMGIAERVEGSAREIRVAGGWGPLISDEGSGYYIGFRALQQACRAEDGIGPDTALLSSLRAHFGVPALRLAVPALYEGSPADIAELACLVDKAALDGDPVAAGILDEAAEFLSAYARTLCDFAREQDTLYVSGSVLLRNAYVRKGLERRLGSRIPGIRIREPGMTPEEAAAYYAMQAEEKA